MHALHRRIDSHVASCIQRNSFTSEMPSSIIGGETFKIRFVRELSKRKGIKPGTIIVVRCNFMTGRQTDAKCVIIIMVIIAWNRAEVLNGYVIYCAGQTVRSLFARPLRLMPNSNFNFNSKCFLNYTINSIVIVWQNWIQMTFILLGLMLMIAKDSSPIRNFVVSRKFPRWAFRKSLITLKARGRYGRHWATNPKRFSLSGKLTQFSNYWQEHIQRKLKRDQLSRVEWKT